ncbi:outer membrane autotransporter protein [Hoeflea marina]|uniref:Outer membrane autotransporter protein n=1 Tax=Hoeflea marina TaxID=274592 RepID=A0A317PLM4_9HYPH|nr:autotransporter outer membrane beta-barrel domain-containing protein [Hoeflea marina]PWW01646.1 outer membrane autotransporter protein [Hoeflea marina]
MQADSGSSVSIYGRLAWAHNFGDEIALDAAYLSLPGSTSTFTGTAQASDLALVTVGARATLTGGWSASARFDGEFGGDTRSYGGKGKLAYTW